MKMIHLSGEIPDPPRKKPFGFRYNEVLRACSKHHDAQYPGYKKVIINPDGIEAADYIDNCLRHLGEILKIVYENIQDQEILERLRNHGIAALRGDP